MARKLSIRFREWEQAIQELATPDVIALVEDLILSEEPQPKTTGASEPELPPAGSPRGQVNPPSASHRNPERR